MSGYELAKQGKCGVCEEATAHGPWTDEKIAKAIADTGVLEFEDWCDNCMVGLCFNGDAEFAEKMLGRPLQK